MSVIVGILALTGLAGCIIAIYEHGQKRVLMAHDLTKAARTHVRPAGSPMNLTIHPSHCPTIF
tara:strand:- start:523 stop:711 length:189 start_codon:yes stop_codon:yes gene_type:complete